MARLIHLSLFLCSKEEYRRLFSNFVLVFHHSFRNLDNLCKIRRSSVSLKMLLTLSKLGNKLKKIRIHALSALPFLQSTLLNQPVSCQSPHQCFFPLSSVPFPHQRPAYEIMCNTGLFRKRSLLS